jgi:hypothetical protein
MHQSRSRQSQRNAGPEHFAPARISADEARQGPAHQNSGKDTGHDRADHCAAGVISRALAPVHIIAVASSAYMAGRSPPADPSGLIAFDGIVMRSLRTGRIRHWTLRNAGGQEMPGSLAETIVVNDPAAVREAARLPPFSRRSGVPREPPSDLQGTSAGETEWPVVLGAAGRPFRRFGWRR